MKKRFSLVLLVCCSCCVMAFAAAGDASDPFISLSYLRDVFTQAFSGRVEETIAKADGALLDETQAQLDALRAAQVSPADNFSPTFIELCLKRGDRLNTLTGTNLVPLAGAVTAEITGVLVDVTTGQELTGTATLSDNHRYLVAEDSTAVFSTQGKSAVTRISGYYGAALSGTTDWRAMADALQQLTLFRGTGAGYGSGYALEQSATRAQALVMLIRLLGEEDEALAFTGSCPFTDVQNNWALPYVAYAYSKGYTNGISATLFGVNQTATATMYTEFILRALGYSSTATTNISDAPDRAQAAGVLTAGECAALKNEPFLRADVVYLSYYALGTPLSGSAQTLAQRLAEDGVFTLRTYRNVQQTITAPRIG